MFYLIIALLILILGAVLLLVAQRYLSGQTENLQRQQALTLVTQQIQQLQLQQQKELHQVLQQNRLELQQSVLQNLQNHTQTLAHTLNQLSETVYERLKDITGMVEKRLSQGFEKTQQTFADVVKRLALIDEAQKRITELSGNVVSLQSLLTDKRSRGAFGEVQLEHLLSNMLPQNAYSLQATLSNGKRADCLLHLPGKLGNMVIDAKFPLESYQKMVDPKTGPADLHQAQLQFARDIKKHIQDIAEKYIIAEETAESAIMFIPAEAIFADIHGHHPELVSLSHQKKVWLTSPTTMMAILTTISAVIKDEQTREQVHVIQAHLKALAKDFERFQNRMDGLQRHIEQAHQDVQSVNTSAKKLTSRFVKIEQVKLSPDAEQPPEKPMRETRLSEDNR